MPRRVNHTLLNEIDEDLEPGNQLIINKKIVYTLKPFPVKPILSKKYFNLIKNKEKLECSICYEVINCECCFTLLSCSHYFHKECYDSCYNTKCPNCNQ